MKTITSRNLTAATLWFVLVFTCSRPVAQGQDVKAVNPADAANRIVESDALASEKSRMNVELASLRKRATRLEQITGNPLDPAVVRAKRRLADREDALRGHVADDVAANPRPETKEARIAKKLDVVDSPRLINKTLGDVLEYLGKLADLKIATDPKSLESAEVTPKTIVNLRANDIRLGDALTLVLEPIGLVYRIEGDGLLVINPNSTVSKPRDLSKVGLEALCAMAEQRLRDLKKDGVEPDMVQDYQIKGAEAWLKQIQAALAHPDDGQRPEAAELLMEMPLGINLADKTLADALSILNKNTGVDIIVDWEELRSLDVKEDTPIYGFAGTLDLGDFLQGVLRPLGLAAMVEGNHLVVKPTPVSLIAETLLRVSQNLIAWKEQYEEIRKKDSQPAKLIEETRRRLETIEAAASEVDRVMSAVRYSPREKKTGAKPK